MTQDTPETVLRSGRVAIWQFTETAAIIDGILELTRNYSSANPREPPRSVRFTLDMESAHTLKHFLNKAL